ncbi:hypothetical protein R1sor_014265 [Riccia sorocarpa]|uniref:Uncharacterized protein n=1 Tax=Riccia sorocarpa TaxID=122646 RepID=A0ABD3HD29_9MARC
MFKYIPEKADKEVVDDEASSSDVEADDGNTRRRKKGKKKSYGADPLPSQIAHRVYCAMKGESAPQRLEPLQVLHIKDIMKYQLTLDEKLDCPLVFLDLTHPHMHAWEKPEFSSFLGIVRNLTVSKCFAVVAIMDFGQAPVDFANALKDMKDARVTVDYGCYEVNRVHNKTDLPYPCWQLIYVFFGQGKKPAASTPVATTVGDYHASSSDVNVASAEAQLEYEVDSEAEDEGHEAPEGPEELHDPGVAELENVAEDLQQLPDSGEPPPSPNQQSGLDLQATSGQGSVHVPPPDAMELIRGNEQGLDEVPAVTPWL